jgi:hypothetical protein
VRLVRNAKQTSGGLRTCRNLSGLAGPKSRSCGPCRDPRKPAQDSAMNASVTAQITTLPPIKPIFSPRRNSGSRQRFISDCLVQTSCAVCERADGSRVPQLYDAARDRSRTYDHHAVRSGHSATGPLSAARPTPRVQGRRTIGLNRSTSPSGGTRDRGPTCASPRHERGTTRLRDGFPVHPLEFRT